MNNSTIPFSCGYTQNFWAACDLITRITYAYAPPICLLIGLPGHVLALIAFLKHRNADTGYSYQILTTITKMLEILGLFQFSLLFYHGAGQDWSGEGPGDGPQWFVSNYGLMWFTAHLPPMLAATATDLAVFASAATAADRVFALWKPFAYQKINHKVHFPLATALCFLIPAACEFHVVFSFGVIPVANSTGEYSIQYFNFFPNSRIKSNWSHTAAVVRTVAEMTLITSSIFMIYRFKQRNRKVQQIGISDSKKDAKRRANEKTLFLLALFQCTATTLPGFLMTAWDVLNYVDRTFVFCGGMMLSPVTDLLLQLINAIDVYFMLCVSFGFRQMVRKVFKRKPRVAEVKSQWTAGRQQQTKGTGSGGRW